MVRIERDWEKAIAQCRSFFQQQDSGQIGADPLVRAGRPRPAARTFCTDYDIVQPAKDAGPDTIDWDRFIATAPKHPFSVKRSCSCLRRCVAQDVQLLILDLVDPISEIDWAANRRYTVT
jgi:hypothetical protein